jgi:hypothetical protein
LTQPWVLDPKDVGQMMVGYKNSPTQPISLAGLEREYCRVTQQSYPIPEMEFARSWMLFRVRHHRHLISSLRAGRPQCRADLFSFNLSFPACGYRTGNCGTTCDTPSKFGTGTSIRRQDFHDGPAGAAGIGGRRTRTATATQEQSATKIVIRIRRLRKQSSRYISRQTIQHTLVF